MLIIGGSSLWHLLLELTHEDDPADNRERLPANQSPADCTLTLPCVLSSFHGVRN
jgi:hypothetical protein